jgi:competence ComEA-like helix-hairpin-helix protein
MTNRHVATRSPALPLHLTRRLGAAVACLLLCACGASVGTVSAAEPAAAQASQPAAKTPPVELNAATEKDLLSLPRVGPSLAKRILEQRKALGGFKRIEDLLTVKGVGEKTLEVLRPFITVVPAGRTEGSTAGRQ